MEANRQKRKRYSQLGMDPATAAHKLRMDIMFALLQKAGEKCYRCTGDLTRSIQSSKGREIQETGYLTTIRSPPSTYGEVAKWLKAPMWKIGRP